MFEGRPQCSRQDLHDLSLPQGIERSEEFERIVRFELGDCTGQALRAELLGNLLAYHVVEFGEDSGIEAYSQSFDQLVALFRFQLFQQVGDFGEMKGLRQFGRFIASARIERSRDGDGDVCTKTE